VQNKSLAEIYSSKTDDELIALAADADALVDEARPVLASELLRRNITVRKPSAAERSTRQERSRLCKTHWLAVATVCVTAAATLTTGGGFLLTIPLALGVIADYCSPRRGRWLMWVGAAFLSVTLLLMQILILPEFLDELRSHHNLGGLGPVLFPLSIASILLIVWCDAALVVDAVKRRCSPTPHRRALGVGDWIVWITAPLFSTYAFGGIPGLFRAYTRGFRSLDLLLPGWAIVLIAISFDIALLIDAAKMWRARGVQKSQP